MSNTQDPIKLALEALLRIESAVDWHLGRSSFTQTKQLKGFEHSAAVRKELFAAHDEVRNIIATLQAPTPQPQGDAQQGVVCEPQRAVTSDGWTDWICPKPVGYLMQCCDCGLVHEVDSRVAHYKPRPSEEYSVVDDPDMQAQWRMRRRDDLAATAQASEPSADPVAITEEMVTAYLKANDAYWMAADKLPRPLTAWRNGTSRDATRESLSAALAVASPARAVKPLTQLLDAAESVCATLEHPTNSVNAMQMWRLRDALKAMYGITTTPAAKVGKDGAHE